MSVSIDRVTAEHHHDGFGISSSTPRLSWRFGPTIARGWQQAFYEIRVSRHGKEEQYQVISTESLLVPWPSSPLSSREVVIVSVRATGIDGSQTNWQTAKLEAALLKRTDWVAALISGPSQDKDLPKAPFRLRKRFNFDGGTSCRLYSTAHGLYNVEINGKVVGNQVLAPGWQSYHHRLHYQVYDVTGLLVHGENTIGVYLGEGWFAGRLGRPGIRNIWGDRLGILAQLEVDGKVACKSDATWELLGDGPILASEIYNGETFDTTLANPSWSTNSVEIQSSGCAEELPFPGAALISPDVAPVRRVMEVRPQTIITTPSGKLVLDFGQNLVGWLRIGRDIPGPGELVIRHAEVLENGELGTRPLRTAKAEARIKLGGHGTKGYEPRFTFYGFRYAEVTAPEPVSLSDFTAVVVTSDIARTGTFECSHPLINKLHENTVWSMRGNFLSVPTDCPQRDERLGWTGDLQVFAPTANYLFDTSAFLTSWLSDLEVDQREYGGIVPIIVPAVPLRRNASEGRAMAVWADSAVMTPWDLYSTFGDKAVLERQWDSMCLWLDKGVPRDETGMYDGAIPQYGDWLDPRAPPHLPGHSPTDPHLVSNAYLYHVTSLVSRIAHLLGKSEAAEKYGAHASRILDLFRQEYVTPNGRLASDTQTAYIVALKFGLIVRPEEVAKACSRLDWLIKWEAFKITTGFVGTPLVLHVLADNGMLQNAYRMLQERDDPSWLYPIRMGATTIWERWNSMLPDGTINPGQMTSFNHYALGSVCSFLHRCVGGLSEASPGWKSALVRPQPGGTIHHASTAFESPYGRYAVSWKRDGDKMKTTVVVPPNGEARVVLSGVDDVVKSGEYHYETDWREHTAWPPLPVQGPQGQEVESCFVE
ncbi:bacterial alpha-L-rhamnosidase-domain-containing protein [Coniochaeta sp. 2T2.1]|nr:bacterial alpha-L-rhamnosidase-domain-containing protein [Coniochaeta sp. 2T2.1]